jgi:hypothetical protein
MAEVKVQELTIGIVSVKLTRKLLLQMERSDSIQDNKEYVRQEVPGKYNPAVIGWIHGSVFETGETYWNWILVNKGNGEFLLIRATRNTCLKFAPSQIYVV